MNAALGDAETDPASRYTWGKTYLKVEYPEIHVSTGTKLRLGGDYLLQVKLSREEIAQLFYETHGGDVVRMFRSFIEDEEGQDYARSSNSSPNTMGVRGNGRRKKSKRSKN